jgi:ATP synthase protein I
MSGIRVLKLKVCMDEEEKRQRRVAMAVNYATLPFVLGVPPIIGWYIGDWIDHHFTTAPYGMYIMLVLGLIAGVREFYRIVKKYKDEQM